MYLEGASFGQQITWQQIKSCTDSIRIVVNKGVTEVVCKYLFSQLL